jgi:hypothetical protein
MNKYDLIFLASVVNTLDSVNAMLDQHGSVSDFSGIADRQLSAAKAVLKLAHGHLNDVLHGEGDVLEQEVIN